MILKHVQSKHTGQNIQSERQTVQQRNISWKDRQIDKQKDRQFERQANGLMYKGEREKVKGKERERKREREIWVEIIKDNKLPIEEANFLGVID